MLTLTTPEIITLIWMIAMLCVMIWSERKHQLVTITLKHYYEKLKNLS